MSNVANRRVFLETAQALAKASQPTEQLVADHMQALATLLSDMVGVPMVVLPFPTKEPS